MRISTFLAFVGGGLMIGTTAFLLGSTFGQTNRDGADNVVTRNASQLPQVGSAEVSEESPLAVALEAQQNSPDLFNSNAAQGDASRLSQIVDQATIVRSNQQDELTDEQKQIVAFFENTAREMNEAGGQRLNHVLEFDHLAINGLDVKYYYTLRKNYADLNPQVVLAEQRAYIKDSVCGDAAVRQLIESYGFRYSYAYLSAEDRLIGKLEADLASCNG